MTNTINVHAQFSGVVAQTIDEIIKSGRAASRTEAIRLTVLDYRQHHLKVEEDAFRRAGESSLAKEFDNDKDREAAKWYLEQFKKGAYDELNKKE